jgi:lipid-A-disaccharide synthase
MRVFVGAGEHSGDRILAALLRELRSRIPNLELRGFGGPLCAAQGLRSLLPFQSLAVNGVGDVLRAAPFLAAGFFRLRRALGRFRPDLVLLADYPGMNVGLARSALRRGLPVHYLAPPQLWAYRRPEKRAGRLRRALGGASLQVLFPFERDCYAPWATRLCTGHFFAPSPEDPAQSAKLLLCPGSRAPVLRRNLPLWLRRLREAGFAGDLNVLVPEASAEAARSLGKGRLLRRSTRPESRAKTGGARLYSRESSHCFV